MSGLHVKLTPAASKLAAHGQPWFFRDDLEPVSQDLHGRIVRVRSSRGDDLGLGFYSAVSRLCLRRSGSWTGQDVPTVEAFFAQRLETAWRRRAHLDEEHRGVRLVHGEGDWLPGLVVDQYDRCLVLQSTSVVIEKNLSVIVPWLRDRVDAESVLARNDISTRRREGLPEEVRLLEGSRTEQVKIRENGISHPIRLFTGQKTGFYLDQRPARRRVRALGKGRRVLDLCSYQGAFSLAALAGGASKAVAVDQSETALEMARQACEDNGLGPITTHCADVFDWLRELRGSGEQFDLVVLDPPAFAKSKREVEDALRGYRDLNRLAMRVLAPDGYLLTCSCSQNVQPRQFESVLRQAAAGLPFPLIVRGRISAGSDHPMWISAPESEYLKVVLLHRVAQAPETE